MYGRIVETYDFTTRRKVPHYERPQGWTYFIAGEGHRLIKIGCTTNEPEKRLKSLQIGSPVRLYLVAAVPGVELEAKLHRELAYCRVRGEWFDCPALWKLARSMAAQVSFAIAREQREWHEARAIEQVA